MKKFPKYKKNLSVVSKGGKNYIKSYANLVAEIDYENNTTNQLGYWSVTTQKHINYVCAELGLTLKK